MMNSTVYIESVLVKVYELLHLELVLAWHLIRGNQSKSVFETFFGEHYGWQPALFPQFNQVEFVSDKLPLNLYHVVVILLYQVPLYPRFDLCRRLLLPSRVPRLHHYLFIGALIDHLVWVVAASQDFLT